MVIAVGAADLRFLYQAGAPPHLPVAVSVGCLVFTALLSPGSCFQSNWSRLRLLSLEDTQEPMT